MKVSKMGKHAEGLAKRGQSATHPVFHVRLKIEREEKEKIRALKRIKRAGRESPSRKALGLVHSKEIIT